MKSRLMLGRMGIFLFLVTGYNICRYLLTDAECFGFPLVMIGAGLWIVVEEFGKEWDKKHGLGDGAISSSKLDHSGLVYSPIPETKRVVGEKSDGHNSGSSFEPKGSDRTIDGSASPTNRRGGKGVSRK